MMREGTAAEFQRAIGKARWLLVKSGVGRLKRPTFIWKELTMSKGYCVSRQRVWPDGDLVVEIAAFLDAAGPDMLVPTFRMEGEAGEFRDPREAAEAADAVRRAWARTLRRERLSIPIPIVFSSVLGPIDRWHAVADVMEWAEARYKRIPKCTVCGKPVYEEPVHTFTGSIVCGERCLDRFATSCDAAEG